MRTRIKWRFVLIIASVSFFFGNFSSSLWGEETNLFVPELPNYVVEKGDTLYGIAQKMNLNEGRDMNEAVHILIKTNKLKGNEISPLIQPGQEIYVPIKKWGRE